RQPKGGLPRHVGRVEGAGRRFDDGRVTGPAEDEIGLDVGGPRAGPHGLVRQQAIAEARVGFDTQRVGQGAGSEADRGLDATIEDPDARSRGQLPWAWRQLGRMARVPRERPVETVRDQVEASLAPDLHTAKRSWRT